MYSFIIFLALFIIGYSITKSLLISLIVAILLSSITEVIFINKTTSSPPLMEGMTSKIKRSRKEKRKRKRSGSGSGSGSGKTDKNMKKILKSRKFPKGKYTFDPKKSYKKTYKSLSNKQIKGLNHDTKSLVKTQEQLMNTLKEMGPVLEQGKSIIGAFDSFFGDGGKKNDLAYMTNRLGLDKK